MMQAVKNGIYGAFIGGMCVLVGCGDMMDDGDEEVYQGNQNQEINSYIFLRHRFAEENATIHSADSTATKLAWSNKHFKEAKEYMLQKVADFKNKVYYQEPDGNFLQAICNEVFVDNNGKPYNGFGSLEIDPSISQNKLNYSNFLGAVAAKVTGGFNDNTDLDYEVFEACYSMLAVRSYNDSLGYLKDSQKLTLNKEKASIEDDLQRLGVGKDYNNLEFRLNNLLEKAAKRSGVSVGTLQDAVNLSLLNASLWGARDLGASAGFQLSGNSSVLQSPSNQISNLNRRDLTHNLGSFWMRYNGLEASNNKNQEQGNSL